MRRALFQKGQNLSGQLLRCAIHALPLQQTTSTEPSGSDSDSEMPIMLEFTPNQPGQENNFGL